MFSQTKSRPSLHYMSTMADERTGVFESNKPRTEDGSELVATHSYVTKKTLAQGMLDVALLMANASQLNTLFRVPTEVLNGFHYTLFVLVFLSIILQIVAGILITTLGFRHMRTHKECATAELLNNSIIILIFVITIINIFINAFDINVKNNI